MPVKKLLRHRVPGRHRKSGSDVKCVKWLELVSTMIDRNLKHIHYWNLIKKFIQYTFWILALSSTSAMAETAKTPENSAPLMLHTSPDEKVQIQESQNATEDGSSHEHPEAAIKRFFIEFDAIVDLPESADFKKVVSSVFAPEAVITLFVGDKSVLNVSRRRLADVSRLVNSKYKDQHIDSQRRILNIECNEDGLLAACFVDIEVFPKTEGPSHYYRDVIGMRLHEGHWIIISAKILIVPTPDATTIYSLAQDPTNVANLRTNQLFQKLELKREWPHRFPIFGQKVYDLGADLPLPWGVSVIPVWNRQEQIISDLRASINGGGVIETGFVNFEALTSETTSLQIKGDLWLFPFLNVFATVGHVKGDVAAPLSFRVGDLIEVVDPGGLCTGLLAPSFCDSNISATIKAKVDTTTAALGIVPAVGYENFFFTVPITYSWAFIDAIEGSPAETFLVSPRIGYTVPIRESGGRLGVYFGGTYLKSMNTILSDFNYTIPADTPVVGGRDINIRYQVTQETRDPWNYVVGFNWNITNDMSFGLEAATGGSRDQIVSSFSKRF